MIEKETGQCLTCGTWVDILVATVLGRKVRSANLCKQCAAERDDRALAEALAERRNKVAALLPTRYRTSDKSQFPPEWERIQNWRPNPEGRGLALIGETGTRKTRMLCALAIHLAATTTSFAFCRASKLAEAVRDQFSDASGIAIQAKERLIRWRKVQVLILDDLGKQTNSPTVEEAVFELIEERTSEALPILATMNATGKELEAAMSAERGAPILRRLREFCEPITITITD